MTRCAGGCMPISCHTLTADTPNDASITSEARPPDTPFVSRRPIIALMMNPTSGNSGISASISPLERRERVGIQRLTMTEQGNHQRQADGRFGGGDGHHEERD